MDEKPKFLPTDFTHPENDARTAMQQQPQGSPLMEQLKSVWSLPHTRKPLGKASKPAKGKPSPRTSRSGVHKLGKAPKSTGGWF